jgi:tetratricopeptide (TPR) repeat protein
LPLANPTRLAVTAEEHFGAYLSTGDRGPLYLAAQAMRAAVVTTPVGDSRFWVRLTNLGSMVGGLSEVTGERALLLDAVRTCRSAVDGAPKDLSGRVNLLVNLASTLRQLGETDRDVAVLREAEAIGMQAFDLRSDAEEESVVRTLWRTQVGLNRLLPPDERSRKVARMLMEFTNDTIEEYLRSGDTDQLHEAVGFGRDAVSVAPSDANTRAGCFSVLGRALQHLFEASGDLDALAEAVQANRAAAEAADDLNRARLLSNHAGCLLLFGKHHGDPAATREAAEAAADAVRIAGPDHPRRFIYLATLGNALAARAADEDSAEIRDEAITALRQALRAAPPGPQLLQVRFHLGEVLHQAGDPALLREAADHLTAAVDAASPADPNIERYHHELSSALIDLYAATAQTGWIAQAAGVDRAALDLATARGADPRPASARLMSDLWLLGRRSENVEALREAAELGRQLLAGLPAEDSRYPFVAAQVATVLTAYAKVAEDDTLLAEATTLADATLSGAEGDPMLLIVRARARTVEFANRQTPQSAAELATACRDAATATNATSADVTDAAERDLTLLMLDDLISAVLPAAGDEDQWDLLDAVAQVARAAVTLTAAEDADGRAARLDVLVGVLEDIGNTRQADDSRAEAVQSAREAVRLTGAADPRRPRRLALLGRCLAALFVARADPPLLTEAIQAGREAVAAAPGDPEFLRSLSSSLVLLAVTGYADTADEAIAMAHAAIAAAGRDSPPPSLLNALGNALTAHFVVTGDLQALRQSVTAFRGAVTDADDGADPKVGYAANLTQSLIMLYQQTDDSRLLWEALEVARQLVAATPADHPERLRRLFALTTVLAFLHHRTGSIDLIEEGFDTADEMLELALQVTPDPGPYLAVVADLCGAAYWLTDDVEHLTERVELLHEAAHHSPPGHPQRPLRLASLAEALLAGSGTAGEAGPHLLALAVATAREAVEGTAATQPAYTGRLYTLARALFLHAVTGPDDEQGRAIADEARARFTELVEHPATSARDRLRTYQFLLTLRTGRDRELVEEAMTVLPLLVDRTLARSDLQHRLAGLHGSPAAHFALVAVDSGDPRRAVEILESTRGVLVADSLRARNNDLARLGERHPDLAQAFQQSGARLDALDGDEPFTELAPGATLTLPTPSSRMAQRREAQDRHARILEEIRAVDGFRHFLEPAFADLAGEAGPGPIVYVVPGGTAGGVAIIVDAPPRPVVTVVPLPALSGEDATWQVGTLLDAAAACNDPTNDPRTRVRAQQEIHGVLRWLWDTVAADVLHAAGFHEADSSRRLWWCPIGITGFLPLHAAGYHGETSGNVPRTVLDRAVSSYVPTVRSLAVARARKPAPRARGTLIVAVQNAPDMPLPGALAEAEVVAAAVPDAHQPVSPSRDEVLAALPLHQNAHFACHGVLADDPSASRLVLDDHREMPLTVADVNRLRLACGLAFLSACETSATSLELVDEAVHLTGAFHLAGYQHVIGTLWPIGEYPAKQMTAGFYQRLAAGPGGSLDLSGTARALHDAVRDLRTRFPRTPSAWAGHLHVGP